MSFRLIVLVAIEVASSLAFGQTKGKASDKAVPRFEDFRVPTPIQARKEPAMVANQAAPGDFNQRLREAAKEGPDFAGHFVVELTTCGSLCELLFIVDVKTGEIYSAPFVVNYACRGEDVRYRLNSKLLVVIGQLEHKNGRVDDPCGEFYYEWGGRQLKLIRFISTDDLPPV